MNNRWGGTITSIDFSERWMRDGLRVVESVGGFCSLTIDMSTCAVIMKRLKEEGTPVKYASVIVCATAKALARHPKLQKLIAGNKKLSGGKIDICLSVSSDEVLTPIVIIEKADQKTAPEIGVELLAKTPLARSDADRVMKLLRRWGWLLPFGFLRRRVIKSLLGQLWYRRAMTGMFQVTILPGLDFVAAQVFNTAAVLAVGGVTERPIVVDGELKVRLAAPFTCTIDHKQWNGMYAAIFLTELRNIFEHEPDILF
jgi:pyruvate dehydrogenase E2 component (dihydrolipoamide acetyltransferase)